MTSGVGACTILSKILSIDSLLALDMNSFVCKLVNSADKEIIAVQKVSFIMTIDADYQLILF